MKTPYRPFVGAIVLTFLTIIQVAVCKADGPYHFIKEIPLSDMGGCSFLSMDEQWHRLYIVCTNKVAIMDLNTEHVVGTITNASGIRGFAAAARTGRGFLTDGQEPRMSMFDLRTYKTVMKINTGQNPATILYDSSRMEVYAFNQGDDSASVYEADDADFLKNIKLTASLDLLLLIRKLAGYIAPLKTKTKST